VSKSQTKLHDPIRFSMDRVNYIIGLLGYKKSPAQFINM